MGNSQAKKEQKQNEINDLKETAKNCKAALLDSICKRTNTNRILIIIADNIAKRNTNLELTSLLGKVVSGFGSVLFLIKTALGAAAIILPAGVAIASLSITATGSTAFVSSNVLKIYFRKKDFDRLKKLVDAEIPALDLLHESLKDLLHKYLVLNAKHPDHPTVVSFTTALTDFCTNMRLEIPNIRTVDNFVRRIFEGVGIQIPSRPFVDQATFINAFELGHDWEVVSKGSEAGENGAQAVASIVDGIDVIVKDVAVEGFYLYQLFSGASSVPVNIRNNVKMFEENSKVIKAFIDSIKVDENSEGVKAAVQQ